jgi:hypothetical protein
MEKVNIFVHIKLFKFSEIKICQVVARKMFYKVVCS